MQKTSEHFIAPPCRFVAALLTRTCKFHINISIMFSLVIGESSAYGQYECYQKVVLNSVTDLMQIMTWISCMYACKRVKCVRCTVKRNLVKYYFVNSDISSIAMVQHHIVHAQPDTNQYIETISPSNFRVLFENVVKILIRVPATASC